jgi:hypothetical protein
MTLGVYFGLHLFYSPGSYPLPRPAQGQGNAQVNVPVFLVVVSRSWEEWESLVARPGGMKIETPPSVRPLLPDELLRSERTVAKPCLSHHDLQLRLSTG